MNVDYIIVGFGIAGICFSKQLLQHNKSFIVISDMHPGATQNSGGVFNPIVLRRFTAPKNTLQYTDVAIKLYQDMQQDTSETWMYPKQNVGRIFSSIEEQNNWLIASDKTHLKPFITPKVQANANPSILAEFGLGIVQNSFKIDVDSFIHSFYSRFIRENRLIEEKFNYDKLTFETENCFWHYKKIKAKNILFAEGSQVVKNPFVPKHILLPNKGEYLIIKAPQLKLQYILKGGVYIIPLGNDLYKVGATYSPEDDSLNATETARIEIEDKLQKMISCDYEIESQVTGIRPVTKDREPILGKLKVGMYIFNGLGSRGFTRAPYYSNLLYHAIENKQSISAKMNVNRFFS